MLGLLVCSSAAAQGIPPLNVTPPSVSDLSPVDGETLTASEGTWLGAPPPSFAFQWFRCEGDADVCAIPGATSSSYTVSPRDVGAELHVRVTASNLAGTASADSGTTGVVAPAPVRNVSVPVVTGTPEEGQVLNTSRGQWTGTPPIELGVRWERCTALGTGCVAIPGATGNSHVLSRADVAMTLRAAVTASNAAGALTVHSALTAIVAAARLVNVEPPEIVGVAQVGQVLRATSGRWAPTGPTDFVYRWLRCTADGSNCAPIPGAIGDRYEVREQDLGSRLRVRVTAIGDAGSASRDSALTAVVTALSAGERAQPRPPRLMRPFPRVRIRGYFTRSGAVLQTVIVRGPRGATAALVCRGSDCPFRHRTRRLNRRLRARSLERYLEAGTKIVVRVSKPRRIGKHTRILIRAGRPPARWDRCLRPGGRAPVRCPG